MQHYRPVRLHQNLYSREKCRYENEKKLKFTRRCYCVDHFHNYQHPEIDKQLNGHNGLALVRKPLSYNEHPNDKENKSKIEFHPMKNRFHRKERDKESVVKFLKTMMIKFEMKSNDRSTLNCCMTVQVEIETLRMNDSSVNNRS